MNCEVEEPGVGGEAVVTHSWVNLLSDRNMSQSKGKGGVKVMEYSPASYRRGLGTSNPAPALGRAGVKEHFTRNRSLRTTQVCQINLGIVN